MCDYPTNTILACFILFFLGGLFMWIAKLVEPSKSKKDRE